MQKKSIADVPRADLETITIDAIKKVEELQHECLHKEAIIEVISGIEYGVLEQITSWNKQIKEQEEKWMKKATELSTNIVDARKRIVIKDETLEETFSKLLSISEICDQSFLESSTSDLAKNIEKISSIISKSMDAIKECLGTGFEEEESIAELMS